MGVMTKFLTAAALATAMTAGAASAAVLSISGGTSGVVPGGTATNNALTPLGFSTPLAGYYGSTINVLGFGAVTFELLGAEAGNTNRFRYIPTGQQLVDAGDSNPNGFFNPAGISSFSVANVLAGLLQFSFQTNKPTVMTVLNGANPNNTTPTPFPGINFFATFADLANSRSGSVLYLFFDDDGANNDDNHDDLVIRVSAVPVPAAGFLLFGALGGLAALRRRRKTA